MLLCSTQTQIIPQLHTQDVIQVRHLPIARINRPPTATRRCVADVDLCLLLCVCRLPTKPKVIEMKTTRESFNQDYQTEAPVTTKATVQGKAPQAMYGTALPTYQGY